MKIDKSKIRKLLGDFDFRTLFIEELGWDYHRTTPIEVNIDDNEYRLGAIVEKRGMVLFVCQDINNGKIPEYSIRRKIEKQVTKYAHEHIIIFLDKDNTCQVWQWIKREPNKPLACREHRFYIEQPGDSLIQKICEIAFSLDEEENLTISEVTNRAKHAFDINKITTRFYNRFKEEHDKFLKSIQGIAEKNDHDWYASIMLNRLMFIYFIQKKGFLDGDIHYLRNHLKIIQSKKGKDKFLSFYRHFLLRLFHEGLGHVSRYHELDVLLGRVPYLNGGLFEIHKIELEYPEIGIPDNAFERIFDFFDSYQWYLDERPLRADNEINPDVLGYIFEKYINQKQMGAYYTGEDITDYISHNTILPYIVNEIIQKGFSLLQKDQIGWDLLQHNPDRYIYEDVKKGIINDRGIIIPPPDFVKEGIEDISLRSNWNEFALDDFALSTETWREYANRRMKCLSVYNLLKTGKIETIEDFITYNLNIRQFSQDIIEIIRNADDLRIIFETINNVKIIDPTCGSGAFLFSSLNILEPLYEASLEVIQRFTQESREIKIEDTKTGENYFLSIIDEIKAHNNQRYFILKSIITNNLFGLDIMEEACEICKLRLFLKLAAQVEPDVSKHNYGLEPLPDIDFNIRIGNAVIGYTFIEEVVATLTSGQMRFGNEQVLSSVIERAEVIDSKFKDFLTMQTSHDIKPEHINKMKQELIEYLSELALELDHYLAREYGVDYKRTGHHSKRKNNYDDWYRNHRPFHWLIQFYGIMKKGGFDVVIGNPPYLNKSKLSGAYEPLTMETKNSRDIYAWFVEQSINLCCDGGRLGLIIPVSFASSESFEELRTIIRKEKHSFWLSHYANRPGQLFNGAQNRLTILLYSKKESNQNIFSTKYHRWDARNSERKTLFSKLKYEKINEIDNQYKKLFPKSGTTQGKQIIKNLLGNKYLKKYLRKIGKYRLYWVRVPGYFCQFFLDPPQVRPEKGGPERNRGELKKIILEDERTQRVLHSILNSSIYYYFYCVYTDGRHINPSDVYDFPLDLESYDQTTLDSLVQLSFDLEKRMNESITLRRKSGLLIDSIDSRLSKDIIDDIDRILGHHYGFSDRQIDFVINYDIKYRMGLKLARSRVR